MKPINKPINSRDRGSNSHQKWWMKLMMSFALIGCMIFSITMPDVCQAKDDLQTVIAMMEKNAAHLKKFFSHGQAEAIRNIVGAARAVYLAPKVTSGGVLVSMEKGNGMILRRHGQEWSDPVFLSISEYSVGFQAGIKESALIMLIMTDKAVGELVNGLQKVGGTGGFALGSLGLGTSGAGGVHGGLEVLVVATSKGAYAGSGVADEKMSELKDLNRAAYGEGYDMSAILSKPGGKFKPADNLRNRLKEAVIQSWAQ
jgi:lipid-binding SYLF domain-containing protein